jgi:hypothetical protein
LSAGEAASPPPPPKPPRILPEVAGIQVNSCESPLCQNFGYPALATRPYRRASTPTTRADYTVTTRGKENPARRGSFNYCLAGSKDKKTPAMRLGLAKASIDPHEILYFF